MKRKIFLKFLGILFILLFIISINNKKKDNDYYFMTKIESNNSYYDNAIEILNNMSLEEKVKELIIARYNDENIKENYGGYIFFENNFKNKSKDEVVDMINKVQENKKIKCITAVDEEGGTVTRISQNRKLSSYTFKSSQDLYNNGGFNAIVNDVYIKSSLLESLGINLNLAPVVDISLNKDDYMYKRTIGQNELITSIYAKEVINASLNTNVTYTLKHFPGYGNNIDTHKSESIDIRTKEELLNKDLLPFKEGINAGAKMIMVSHNIVSNIDKNNPASLSYDIHALLRKDLNYKNLIITDDLSMKALDNIENKCEKAILVGNDLIITKEPKECVKEIINSKKIKKEVLDNIALRILLYKFNNNLIIVD